jgi:hypothetical protein
VRRDAIEIGLELVDARFEVGDLDLLAGEVERLRLSRGLDVTDGESGED